MKLTGSAKYNVLLYQMGINTPRQVLEHLPRRYDSFLYTPEEHLYHLQDKEKAVLYGKVVGRVRTLRFAKAWSTHFSFETEGGTSFEVQAWNRPYLSKQLQEGKDYTLQVSYDASRHEVNLLVIKPGKIPPEEALVPVYTLPPDYPSYQFRLLVKKSLTEEKGKIHDTVPLKLREKYRLIPKEEAIAKAHFPSSLEDVHQAMRTLKYEEALLFSLKNQLIREENKALSKEGVKDVDHPKLRDFVHSLPYKLTNDQKNAIAEALKDMESERLMYRLLQGDVGTGKTAVAAALMVANATRGSQSALMAPTDALARQHQKTLEGMLKGTGCKVTLLVGSLSTEERKKALEEISSGESQFIVGTHALFSEGVNYADLGLAIVDEQHKFGVNQRAELADKGTHADLLLMSATPIPRTLALTLYGDLDVSTLTEFPSGTKNIVTKIVSPKDKLIPASVEKSISSGHRVYVVAPQIEGGEDEKTSVLAVYQAYERKYGEKAVMLHGQMKDEEKEEALRKFASGECPILVATSVIEVGIDVKQADLMIIYSPSHFALSSLHQLRGRIGRDGSPSLCLLAYDGNDEEEQKKLDVLVNTLDGFQIAEADLAMRGPGNIAGVRQSGLPDFKVANLVEDYKMFLAAREDAKNIVEEHEDDEEYRPILYAARKSLEVTRSA